MNCMRKVRRLCARQSQLSHIFMLDLPAACVGAVGDGWEFLPAEVDLEASEQAAA